MRNCRSRAGRCKTSQHPRAGCYDMCRLFAERKESPLNLPLVPSLRLWIVSPLEFNPVVLVRSRPL